MDSENEISLVNETKVLGDNKRAKINFQLSKMGLWAPMSKMENLWIGHLFETINNLEYKFGLYFNFWAFCVSAGQSYQENIAKGTTDPGVDCFDQ